MTTMTASADRKTAPDILPGALPPTDHSDPGLLDLRFIKSFEETQQLVVAAALATSSSSSSKKTGVSFEFNEHFADSWCSLVYNFEHINLNHLEQLTDEGVLTILKQNGATLKYLSLYWSAGVTDISVSKIAAFCPNLQMLNLSGCQKITDSGVNPWFVGPDGASMVETLRDLDLTRCPLLTNPLVRKITRRCQSLHSLNLYANATLGSGAFALENCRDLVFLDVCGSQIEDETLASLPGTMRVLNLTWCVRLTDEGLLALASRVEALEFLSVFGNTNITDVGVDALAEKFGDTLTTLDVNGCTGVVARGMEDVRKKFPRVKVFAVHS